MGFFRQFFAAFLTKIFFSARAINEDLKSNSENGCIIKEEFVEFGDSIEYPEFCVKLICQNNGNVDVRSMRESSCRRRKIRN